MESLSAFDRNALWAKALAEIYPERFRRWQKVRHFAHYTSLSSFQKILTENTMLFSSVSDMNDREEITGVIFHIADLFLDDRVGREVRLGLESHYPEIIRFFDQKLSSMAFSAEHHANVYCVCVSEHDTRRNRDGDLAMWRAYGGDGNGVAVVLSRSQDDPTDDPWENVPVAYLSEARLRAKARRALVQPLRDILVTRPTLSDAQQRDVANLLYKVAQMLAVGHKHRGFKQEAEWRLVYIHEPNSTAPSVGTLTAVEAGRRLRPVYRVPLDAISAGSPWHNQITEIIIGPSDDREMHRVAICNFLTYDLNRPELASKVRVSSIPYRTRK